MSGRNALSWGAFEPDAGNALAPPPTQADAADWHRQNLSDAWAAAKDPQTWQDAAQQYGGAMLMGSVAPEAKGLGLDAAAMKLLREMQPQGFKAYHGSPHSFDKFDTAKIGTGEGAQAYGHGLYLADSEGVARSYRDDLTIKQPPQSLTDAQNKYNAAYNAVGKVTGGTNEEFAAAIAERDAAHAAMLKEKAAYEAQPKPPGHMYEVQVNADPAHFLDWDKPLSEQSPHVQQALAKVSWAEPYLKSSFKAGQIAPHTAEGAEQLRAAGIPGIRYLDGGSRADGAGTSNHVIFDADTIAILRKYGIAGLIAGGGAAAAGREQ